MRGSNSAVRGLSPVPIFLVPLLLLPVSITAHHSNAEYDRSIVREFAGEIADVRWRNPHIQITVSIQEADGSTQELVFEGQDVNSLDRRGVPGPLMELGDPVRVVGNPSTRRPELYRLHSVLLPDGVEVVMREGVDPRWAPDNSIGGSGWITEEGDDSAVDGIFRTWTNEDGIFPEVLDDPPFTELGRAAFPAFDPVMTDPAIECIAPGMPRAMTRTGPHPIEFVRQGADILMRMEFFDLERVVYMDSDLDPDSQPATPLGFSKGHWEGDTLVVETSRINWPYMTIDPLVGAPQSDEVRIVERFALSEDETELLYDITVTDPIMLTEPIVAPGYTVYRWDPRVAIQRFNCIAE